MEYSGGDPLVTAAPDGGRRTGRVAHFFISRTQDEDMDELIKNDPIANSGLVVSPRMGAVVLGDQGLELVPEGINDGRW